MVENIAMHSKKSTQNRRLTRLIQIEDKIVKSRVLSVDLNIREVGNLSGDSKRSANCSNRRRPIRLLLYVGFRFFMKPPLTLLNPLLKPLGYEPLKRTARDHHSHVSVLAAHDA